MGDLHAPHRLEHTGENLPQRDARDDAQEDPHAQVALEDADCRAVGRAQSVSVARRQPCFSNDSSSHALLRRPSVGILCAEGASLECERIHLLGGASGAYARKSRPMLFR